MALASSPRRKVLTATLALLGSVALGACSSPPKPPKPTVVNATLSASDNLNPDSGGRASPLVVRVYELKALSAFNESDFFSIWDRDQQTLGGDLNAREEIVLRPGDSHGVNRTTKPETRFIGVVAAYRDLERAAWRASVPVVPNNTLTIMVKLDDRSVSIVSAPPAPAK